MMRALVTLLVAAVIGFGIYHFALRNVQPEGERTSVTQSITLTGVRNDLNAIAKAQRIHLTQHGRYGTMDELLNSAALSLTPRGREGYDYIVEVGGNWFTITARYTRPSELRWPTLMIDQSMEIREVE